MIKENEEEDGGHLFASRASEYSEQTLKNAQTLSASQLNVDSCQLCRSGYDLSTHLPRVLVQCGTSPIKEGHTVCSCCCALLFAEQAVVCPFCMKKIHAVSEVAKMPVNSQIFSNLIIRQKINEQLTDPDPNNADNQSKLVYSGNNAVL